MPWSRRRSQGEDGCDNGLGSNRKSCSGKEHQSWAAPGKRSRLQPPKDGRAAEHCDNGIEWFVGEHHAKNPLDETARDYMGIESGLQSGWQ